MLPFVGTGEVIPYAFSAHPEDLRKYSPLEPVVYNIVQTNVGGAFDATTSSFTCPVHGVYLFSASVLSDMDRQARVALHRNSEHLFNSRADAMQGENSASNSIVIECFAGDRIWVESPVESDILPWRNALFSGALIHEFANDGLYGKL